MHFLFHLVNALRDIGVMQLPYFENVTCPLEQF